MGSCKVHRLTAAKLSSSSLTSLKKTLEIIMNKGKIYKKTQAKARTKEWAKVLLLNLEKIQKVKQRKQEIIDLVIETLRI